MIKDAWHLGMDYEMDPRYHVEPYYVECFNYMASQCDAYIIAWASEVGRTSYSVLAERPELGSTWTLEVGDGAATQDVSGMRPCAFKAVVFEALIQGSTEVRCSIDVLQIRVHVTAGNRHVVEHFELLDHDVMLTRLHEGYSAASSSS